VDPEVLRENSMSKHDTYILEVVMRLRGRRSVQFRKTRNLGISPRKFMVFITTITQSMSLFITVLLIRLHRVRENTKLVGSTLRDEKHYIRCNKSLSLFQELKLLQLWCRHREELGY